jgi:cobyrinic acid a,c-diamide synthase
MKPQFLIGGTSPACGKTLITLGLAHAIAHTKGLRVQPYKCGREYANLSLYALAADSEPVNLDGWLASKSHVQSVYNQYGQGADALVVEGSGSLFDGYRRSMGSSAEVAQLLGLPVVLIVNACQATYSVAPILYGYKFFNSTTRIAGVIFNRVASPQQYSFLREVCQDVGIDSLGYIPEDHELERFAKDTPPVTATNKAGYEALITRMAEHVNRTVDVYKLLRVCQRNFPCHFTLPFSSDVDEDEALPTAAPRLRIAVARDYAFSQVYRETLDRLSKVGRITYFSPIHSRELPPADLIYLPDGGQLNPSAQPLHRRKGLLQELKAYAEQGGKILAEGYGILPLVRTFKRATTVYDMTGIVPIDVANERYRSGYRKTVYNGLELRGFESNAMTVLNAGDTPSVAQQWNIKGEEVDTPLYRFQNVIASPTCWYWGETDLLRLWD